MVECHLAKVDVEGSNPFSRSTKSPARPGFFRFVLTRSASGCPGLRGSPPLACPARSRASGPHRCLRLVGRVSRYGADCLAVVRDSDDRDLAVHLVALGAPTIKPDRRNAGNVASQAPTLRHSRDTAATSRVVRAWRLPSPLEVDPEPTLRPVRASMARLPLLSGHGNGGQLVGPSRHIKPAIACNLGN